MRRHQTGAHVHARVNMCRMWFGRAPFVSTCDKTCLLLSLPLRQGNDPLISYDFGDVTTTDGNDWSSMRTGLDQMAGGPDTDK